MVYELGTLPAGEKTLHAWTRQGYTRSIAWVGQHGSRFQDGGPGPGATRSVMTARPSRQICL